MTTARLRDAAELLRSHVDTAIGALELDDKDAAAVKLAREYADLIDSAGERVYGSNSSDIAGIAWALRWIGPLLLDTLTELGATPAARARAKKGDRPADATPNRLTQLRAASTANRRP